MFSSDRFETAYRRSVADVMRFIGGDEQSAISKHNPGLAAGRTDLNQYLVASEIRYRLAVKLLGRQVGNAVMDRGALDVGGFLGAFPLTLARLGIPTTLAEVYSYYGGALDALATFLETEGVRIFDADFTQALPEHASAEKYAWVTNMAMVEHLADSPALLLRNLRAVTHSDGALILETPNIGYWPRRWALLRGRTVHPPIEEIFESASPFLGHHHEYTADELASIARWSGFHTREIVAFNYSLGRRGRSFLEWFPELVYYWPSLVFQGCKEVLITVSTPAEIEASDQERVPGPAAGVANLRPVTFRENPKQAAIDQWTADPCGVIPGDPGTREYFERLLLSRDDYVRGGGNGSWMVELLDYRAAKDKRVLDVGCGQGTDLYRYAAAGADATGIDLTPRHVELARAHLAAMGVDGQVVQGDAERLPFPSESFDRVSSNGVLHHTPDMSTALREVARVLKPGGQATIIVYHRASTFFWITLMLRFGIYHGRLRRGVGELLASSVEESSIGARPLVRVYSRRQLRRMMQAAGFSNLTMTVRHEASDLTPLIRGSRLHDSIGRIAGWYLIAQGTRTR